MERDSRIEIEPMLWDAAEKAAEAEGASITEFVHRALVHRLALATPAAYLSARAARARPEAFLGLLDRAPDVPPIVGDERVADEPGLSGRAHDLGGEMRSRVAA